MALSAILKPACPPSLPELSTARDAKEKRPERDAFLFNAEALSESATKRTDHLFILTLFCFREQGSYPMFGF